MSVYYVMRPESTEVENPVFTRFGRMTENLVSATKRAHGCKGKVYETNGGETALICSFWEEPAPKTKKSPREYRQERNLAQLFAEW